MTHVARGSLRRAPGDAQRATTLELFYDLVFVFAVTQVAHLLLDHLTWEGVGQATLVLLVVWWSWNYTTWVTNELDPASIAVRLLLIALMLASLLMAIAIPEAFGDKALLFAGAYVAIQVGRHAFLTFVAAGAGTHERGRAGRILTVVIVAGILLTAVGDELVIAHPTEELPDAELAAVVGGPALYLLAHVALRLRMTAAISIRRLTGALACLAVAAIGTFAPALVVAGLLFGVLVAVIVADHLAGLRRGLSSDITTG